MKLNCKCRFKQVLKNKNADTLGIVKNVGGKQIIIELNFFKWGRSKRSSKNVWKAFS